MNPTCLTRRLWDGAARLLNKAYPFRWWWRGAVLLAALGFAVHMFSSAAGIAAFLVFMIVFCLFADLLPIAIDLPVAVCFSVVWVGLTVTSIVDLFIFLPYLWRPGNKIALGVMLINTPIAAYILAWMLLT